MTTEPLASAAARAFAPDTAVASEAPLIAPVPQNVSTASDPADLFTGLVQALGDGDKAFANAQRAENAVVAGTGDIATMIFERARADAILQIASGAASHLAQSLSTVLQMQV